METENNKSFHKVELRDTTSENLHVLLDTIEEINQSRELKSVLEESMEAIRLVMSSAASSLLLLDDETGELDIILPTGPAKKEIRGKRIPKNKGIGGWVIENRQPYISNDPENSDIFWGEVADEFKTKNIICVPLINKENKAIGVLQALNKRRGEKFNPHDIPVFQALASHITMAIERVRKQDELRSQVKNRERLLSEYGKRTEQSLVLLSSVISNKIDKNSDGSSKKLIKEINDRVQALKEIQTFLSPGNLADRVALGVYLQRLGNKICKAISGESTMKVKIAGEQINVKAEKALISGFILYELLIKIYQSVHSEPAGDLEQMEIRIGKENGRVSINLEKNRVMDSLLSDAFSDLMDSNIMSECGFSVNGGNQNSLVIQFSYKQEKD